MFLFPLQITAETAYDMMSPGPSVKRIRHNQPQDFREGVAKACLLIKEVRFHLKHLV